MKQLDSNAKRIPEISSELQHWRVDPDLESVRDPGALSALSETERADWQALWSELNRAESRGTRAVERLISTAGSGGALTLHFPPVRCHCVRRPDSRPA